MDYLLSLPGGWLAWRWVCVRSAGFPIDEPLALAGSSTLFAGLDEVSELDAQREAIVAQLFEDCRAAREAAGQELRSAWTKVIKQLDRGAVPASLPQGAPQRVTGGVAELTALVARRDARVVELQRLLGDEWLAASKVLRLWAAEPRFREAMLIQNSDALKNAADPLLGHPIGATNYKTRRLEHLIANYLQRYTTKNDTISFFGPLAWGELGDDDSRFSFESHDPLLRRREMFLEHWMIDALAEAYSDDPELRRDVAPRLWSTVRLDGDELVIPIEQRTAIPAAVAAVLGLCDGTRSAAAIAAIVCEGDAAEFSDEAEVFAVLDDLVEHKVIVWRLEIPTVGRRFEAVLRDQLEALPDSTARANALAQLATIDAATAGLVATTGAAERMGPAVDELVRCFAEQTGKTASRKGGAIYAARTLFYEDCVRNIDVTIGSVVTRAMGAPLALLAQSARWCTYVIAQRYRQLFDETYRRLVENGAPREIPYLQFWAEVAPEFSSMRVESALVDKVGTELQARWRDVLEVDYTQSRCDRSSDALQARVAERFDAPHPGWPTARYHSPDIMIAASSVDAINRGDALLVLGELHPSINNLCLPFVLHQHPDADKLMRARELDIPQVCVVPVTSRHNTTRSDHNWTSAQNVDFELGDTRSWRPRNEVLTVSELVIAQGPRGLEVRSRDQSRRFDMITFFEYQIIAAGMTRFSILETRPHTPRLTIDRLIVERESWRFERAALEFLAIEDRFERLRAVHSWRRREGLPRFVFFRASQEWKPCYLDFDSPTYIDIFAQLGRKAEFVNVSEMLPGIDEAWLSDPAGKRYASELRIVMVDPVPYPDAG